MARAAESLNKSSPQTDLALDPSMDWIHVPTPGDHYSPSTGSAVMTVIYQLSRCHVAAGGRSRVLVSEGTYEDHYSTGEVIKVAATRPASKPARALDSLAGRLGLQRRFSAAAYTPMVRAIPPEFRGVVLVQNGPPALEPIRRRAPRCRLYLYLQNDLFRTYSQSEAERVLAHSDGAICVSRFIRDLTAAQAPAAAGALSVVMSGVDLDAFGPLEPKPNAEPGDPLVLYVGRVVPQKGVDLLVRAAAALHKRGVRLRLRVVGSSGFCADAPLSSYEQELRGLAKPLGERAEFVPFVGREQIVDHYHMADIFCVPSVWDEPLGLILAEGMACGLPVVAARRGGIPEVGGEAAVYFDPAEPDALVAALEPLLRDRALRKRHGSAAHRQAQSLAWSGSYAVLADVLRASRQGNRGGQ